MKQELKETLLFILDYTSEFVIFSLIAINLYLLISNSNFWTTRLLAHHSIILLFYGIFGLYYALVNTVYDDDLTFFDALMFISLVGFSHEFVFDFIFVVAKSEYNTNFFTNMLVLILPISFLLIINYLRNIKPLINFRILIVWCIVWAYWITLGLPISILPNKILNDTFINGIEILENIIFLSMFSYEKST